MMDVVLQVVTRRLVFCYSSIWQPVMEGFSLLPSLSLSNKRDSIGHNWLLFEDRY